MISGGLLVSWIIPPSSPCPTSVSTPPSLVLHAGSSRPMAISILIPFNYSLFTTVYKELSGKEIWTSFVHCAAGGVGECVGVVVCLVYYSAAALYNYSISNILRLSLLFHHSLYCESFITIWCQMALIFARHEDAVKIELCVESKGFKATSFPMHPQASTPDLMSGAWYSAII